MPAHGRVDRREPTTEPALLLTLRRERLLAVRERLPLLREGLSVRRLLLERLLPVLLRLAVRLAGCCGWPGCSPYPGRLLSPAGCWGWAYCGNCSGGGP